MTVGEWSCGFVEVLLCDSLLHWRRLYLTTDSPDETRRKDCLLEGARATFTSALMLVWWWRKKRRPKFNLNQLIWPVSSCQSIGSDYQSLAAQLPHVCQFQRRGKTCSGVHREARRMREHPFLCGNFPRTRQQTSEQQYLCHHEAAASAGKNNSFLYYRRHPSTVRLWHIYKSFEGPVSVRSRFFWKVT